MAVDFVAIDVEIASRDMASICQIGIAGYRDGALMAEWATYIDPETHFDPRNTAIHGIDSATVSGAPRLPDIASDFYACLDDQVVVSHTPFDRIAIEQAMDRYGLRLPNCRWIDTARVARRAWKRFSRKGYGLDNVCAYIGYRFDHHDALEDAKAAGQVMLSAIEYTGLDVAGWLEQVEQRTTPSSSRYPLVVKRAGNPEGTLFGEVVVFTGELSLSRREAADLAAAAGCQVAANVTKKTTLLVVGDQDVRRLAGHQKSTKHRKAETLAAKGQKIRILIESDFKALVASEESQ